MKNRKISTQFWAIIGATWLVGTLSSGFLIYTLGEVRSAYDEAFTKGIHEQDAARMIQVEFKKQVQEWKDVLLRGSDPESLAKYSRAFHEREKTVQAATGDLLKTVTEPEAKSLLANFQQAHQTMGSTYEKALDEFTAAKGKNQHEADAMVKGQDRAPTDLIDQVVARLNAHAQALAASQKSTVESERRWIAILLMACFAFIGAGATTIVRRVNGSLRRAVAGLLDGSEQVASAASQVSASSQSLAQSSCEQAASLEETSASGEEINSMARRNTENSRSAADLVTRSQQKFAETNQSLNQMVSAMDEIKASSDKISKIIKTIDEIAFQTNILALNAAVEAARAGEAGMGFAVVADEVRNLAQRCAQAAQDTASLIEESIAKSNDGKTKVDQVAVAIRVITEESAKVKTLVDDVNQGSLEQARGIEQIGKAILQMEQVTQKTASSAEESAAAAEELNAQSETLKDIVGRLSTMVGGGKAGSGSFVAKRVAAEHRDMAVVERR